MLVTRQKFMTILEGKAVFYLSTLVDLLRDPEFKRVFVSMKNFRFLLPEKERGGVFIDSMTSFGVFMRLSVLGQKNSGHIYQESLALQRFE